MVFAEGTNVEESWQWAAVKSTELNKEVTKKNGSIASNKTRYDY